MSTPSKSSAYFSVNNSGVIAQAPLSGFPEQCTQNLKLLPDAPPHDFVLQFSRGKAATEQAARLAHFLLLEKPFRLSLSSRWAFNSPSLFEQLSLSSFHLFGSGLSGLGEYLVDWREQTSIQADLHPLRERVLPLGIEYTLYRVVQEALANVTRHSGATRVEIYLNWEIASVHLRIEDNGHGFDLHTA